MLTPADADKLIRAQLTTFHREDAPIASAHGHVLRADIRADRDLPPFDRVTMDGYALRATSLAAGGLGIKKFRVESVQAAGMRPFKLSAAANACIEIMTGAVLPEGADCVVPYEETTRDGAAVTIFPRAQSHRPPAGRSPGDESHGPPPTASAPGKS